MGRVIRVSAYLLGFLLAFGLPTYRADAQDNGIDALAPFAAFLGGVFPSSTPGPSGLQASTMSRNLGVGMLLSLTTRDGTMYAGSRDGRIVEIVPGSTTEVGTLFLDISDRVWTGQDSGLLGVAFHPEYDDLISPNRGYLYLYYVHEAGDGDHFRASNDRRVWGGLSDR